ncbi:unnamed protein product, partial [Allacma fusca]
LIRLEIGASGCDRDTILLLLPRHLLPVRFLVPSPTSGHSSFEESKAQGQREGEA